jgi:transcriptional regulator with XRE-family HTH domain
MNLMQGRLGYHGLLGRRLRRFSCPLETLGGSVEAFAEILGRVLRGARLRRNMTLQQVKSRTGGRFKPSALGGYERGERRITLERFCALATLYGVPGDRLLAEALEEMNPQARGEVIIDLNRLSRLETESGRLVAEFVHNVRAQRGDYLSDLITLRSGDLETLSLISNTTPKTLVSRLRPAIRGPKRSEATRAP